MSSDSTRQLIRREALVLRTEANFCTVLADDGRTELINYTRRLKSGERVATTPVVIGDRVRVRGEQESGALIEEVLPRLNELSRLAPGRDAMKDVLAANLDSVVIIQSLRLPDFNAARLDRFLAIAEQAEIPAAVVLNKADMASAKEAEVHANAYRRIGYPVAISSAKQGAGIQEVRKLIQGTSALIGASGVGKSTILNHLLPDRVLRTADVSEVTGKGRHTTVVAELLPLGESTYVADTPGLRSIGLTDVDRYEVASLFKELQPLIGRCRFADCLHMNEPGCVVLEAIEKGEFSRDRHKSYQRLVQDVAGASGR